MHGGPPAPLAPGPAPPAQPPHLRLALVYDLDACRGPTGVTRHALAQLERLAIRAEVKLHLVSGRIRAPEGIECWNRFGSIDRHQLPLRTRDLLRIWRLAPWPPLEVWTGPLDWVYCPAEYFIPTGRARRAVTSHDVLQDLRFGHPRRVALLKKIFASADVILSVSQFNTRQLLDAFPGCQGRVAEVPNGAEDLFFEPTSAAEIALARQAAGLRQDQLYLLSVANFQPRKNLARLLSAAGRLPEVASGELALVLVGVGSDTETAQLRQKAEALNPRAVVRFVGYRQGLELRALYAGASALVFPSLCESFGIPVIEAMAQGCPVALADSTALPEIGGAAGWYFPPEDEEAITSTLRSLLDDSSERARRVSLGRDRALLYRWDAANNRLLSALGQSPRTPEQTRSLGS